MMFNRKYLNEEWSEMLRHSAILVGSIRSEYGEPRNWVFVDGECSLVGQPFFKVCDADKLSNATQQVRISLLTAGVVPIEEPHPAWDLPSMVVPPRLGKGLNDLLSRPSPLQTGRTMWSDLILSFNVANCTTPCARCRMCELMTGEPSKLPHLPLDIPMPDYRRLRCCGRRCPRRTRQGASDGHGLP